MSFVIGGLQKSSLIDYPEKISAVVFTQGCNFRCGYCHNPELANLREITDYDTSTFLEFLKTRKNKLDGVVITGGEPCLQLGLKDFIKEIKSMNFLVKLDTNGSFPEKLEELLNENLLDYVAMDIKAPLKKYSEITTVNVDTKKIQKSINLLINSKIDYEFRTTVVKSKLNEEDLHKIGQLINGSKKYYLQKFLYTKTIDNAFAKEKSYTDFEFEKIISNFKKYIEIVDVR